jgi:branched-chain amino acid transport system substrate-binding protein
MRVSTKCLAPALIVGLAAAATLSACGAAPKSATANADSSVVNVGMIYSKTGLLAEYGAEYRAGFEAGMKYATNGTNAVDGHQINISWNDDKGDANTASNEAKTLIGQGDKIIAGTTDSGIATTLAQVADQNQVLYISGPAAADALTGVNQYTFRSGRQSYQDVATAGTFVGDPSGKKVLVFAQDTTFGQGNLAAVKAVLGAKGADVSSVLVPESATDFTPFAHQIIGAKPDLVFVAWAGDTTAPMWKALQQQGVFGVAPVVTGLANTASYAAYGPATDKIKFLSYYFPGAGGTDAEKAMISDIEASGAKPDLFSPDGFVAAQMIVHAIQAAGGDDVTKMIAGLDGWSFDSVKGRLTIRSGDHAVLQPMFQAQLTKGADGSWTPKLLQTVPADTVAPPAAG